MIIELSTFNNKPCVLLQRFGAVENIPLKEVNIFLRAEDLNMSLADPRLKKFDDIPGFWFWFSSQDSFIDKDYLQQIKNADGSISEISEYWKIIDCPINPEITLINQGQYNTMIAAKEFEDIKKVSLIEAKINRLSKLSKIKARNPNFLKEQDVKVQSRRK